VVIGVLSVLALSLWPVHIIEVRLPRQNGRVLVAMRATENTFVKLAYRHSVELTTVEGWFQVGPGSELLAVKTRMESVGTGLPNAFPNRTTTRNGWLVVDEGRRPVGSIRFFVVPINQTVLTIGDLPVDLTLLEMGTVVEVTAERTNIVYWTIRSFFDPALTG